MSVDIRQHIAKVIDRVAALVGVTIILVAAILVATTWVQLALIVLGILLLEVATWRMASKFMRSGRRFHLMRVEVHHFMKLMRGLNDAARDGKQEKNLYRLRQSMVDSVDRMFEFAGREDDE